MKRVFMALVISMLAYHLNLFAQNICPYLKIGFNSSSFRSNNTFASEGGQIGGGFQFEDQNNPFFPLGFFQLELDLIIKRGTLKNKIWESVPEIGVDPRWTKGDIQASLSYLSFAYKTGGLYKIFQDFNFGLLGGFLIQLPIQNNSGKKAIKEFPAIEDTNELDYKRIYPDKGNAPFIPRILDSLGKTEFHIIIGSRVKVKKISFEFSYYYALIETKDLQEIIFLDIHEKLDSYTLSIEFPISLFTH